ncbi:mobile element protein [Vibrio astriarenae]|nr:mobile element protein [Vibrio sp. C7]
MLSQQDPRYEPLRNIPGFGPILTAALISEVGAGHQFQNGRQFSAWCGLVPKQNSTGGKSCLGSLSKNGNRELRALLIHGARTVVRCGANKADSMGTWMNVRLLCGRDLLHESLIQCRGNFQLKASTKITEVFL